MLVLLVLSSLLSLPAQADVVVVVFTRSLDPELVERRIAALELIIQEEGGEILFVNDDDRVLLRVDESSYPLLERLTGGEPFLYHACVGWSPPCSQGPFPVVVNVEPSGRDDFVAAVEAAGRTISQEYDAGDGTIFLQFGAPLDAIPELSQRPEVVRFRLQGFGPPLGKHYRLFLGEGFRFIAEATWQTAHATGDATPIQWTTDTGAFRFFRPDNVELTIKVLDGCAITGHHWVFVAGMTNLGVTLTVSSATATRTYVNPLGKTFETITDTLALPCE